jgi:hypothetical protein
MLRELPLTQTGRESINFSEVDLEMFRAQSTEKIKTTDLHREQAEKDRYK